jgi:3-hydroxyisobutyrate dehydrogenase-like beta-hydroxyacid dehydrogenase
MSDVSVIGAGAMGSALVEVLAASGADVTVWNRTKVKAGALAGQRVGLAASVAEALTTSPLTIVAVSFSSRGNAPPTRRTANGSSGSGVSPM